MLISLLDAQEADGGYPADPIYRTVPTPLPRWYGSRAVTAAAALRALTALSRVSDVHSRTEQVGLPELNTRGVSEP